jgi:hypothetical protein
MSVDGYFYGTRRWPLFIRFSCLDPFKQFVFPKPPQLPLSFAKWVRWDIANPCPSNQRPSVHPKNLRGLLGIEKMMCHRV